ncbi:MAG: Gfo/Idh/MocA family oxidoreductase [Planctomycetota bacterium]|nr:Gfo/Idh/MocA family oxidoreductase [Planctomycetota bacterium]
MGKVRIAVVGLGGMGSHHAMYIRKGEVPDAVLSAVCDVRAERLEWAKNNLGEEVRRFDSWEKLIESGAADGVLIAAHHYLHPPIAIRAFEKGLHVLTEKPAGVYTKHVREMNEAAARSGRVFGIMFNLRTYPVYRKLKDLISSGELGPVIRTNWIITSWFRSQSYYDSGGWRATWAGEGGGVLLNQCPHNLDIWQWVCGLPKRVRAFCSFGKYHNIEVEDDVTAYVEYENGATGVFIASTAESPGTDRFEISGDRGKVVVEDGQITFWRTRQPVSQFCREYKGGFGEPESWKCEVPVKGQPGGHKGITSDWVQSILKGTPLIAPGAEGIRSLELSNAMYLSAWTDSWVNIPVDEALFLDHLQKRMAESRFKKTSQDRTMNVEGSFGRTGP